MIHGVVGSKGLVPSAPVSSDGGVARLREQLATQRPRCWFTIQVRGSAPAPRTSGATASRHVAAARSCAPHARTSIPSGRRSLAQPLRRLSEATGPIRDLDVLLEYLEPQLHELGETDQGGAAGLMACLAERREGARRGLLKR